MDDPVIEIEPVASPREREELPEAKSGPERKSQERPGEGTLPARVLLLGGGDDGRCLLGVRMRGGFSPSAAVATLLANGGFVATRLAPAPDGEPVQTVASEEEALAVIRLLVAELSLVGDMTARVAAGN